MTEIANNSVCPHCGSSIRVWKHRLSLGLVNLLIKFISAVKSKGLNSVHLQKDMDLTKSEYNNFQKLHYFGLVAKDDKRAGHWVITRYGGEFLRNERAIPVYALTFKNKLIEREGGALLICQYLQDYEHDQSYWQKMFDYNIFQGKLI